MIVTALNRYAVKGLSGDALTRVELVSASEAFPDDRRFALLQRRHRKEFQEHDESGTLPWLHKEKFLCAFTDPALFARLRTDYSIRSPLKEQESRGYPNDAHVLLGTSNNDDTNGVVRRILTVRDRASGIMLLPELDLSRRGDRDRLQDFMSAYSGRDVVCVTVTATATNDANEGVEGIPETSSSRELGATHTHQFGNTSSGYKQRGDTRTVHIVTQQTVDALSSAAEAEAVAAADMADDGGSSRKPFLRLRPNRFRPNIVVDGGPSLAPFEEFQWIGKRIKVIRKAAAGSRDVEPSGLELSVIAKTVRCRGVSVDPEDGQGDGAAAALDVPDLLVRHFPEHGPYLGVYAVVEGPGVISLGDELSVLPLN